MKSRKPNNLIRSKLIIRLKLLFEADLSTGSSDLFIQNTEAGLIPVYFYEEQHQIVAIEPGIAHLLWTHPPEIIDEYEFCPDRRIQTHRLLGKPALGPSPPDNLLNVCNTTGCENFRLN
jgi:hypothetical protein